MEILLLIIGILIGTVVGYLAADRKSAALRAEISGTKKEIELLKLQKEEAEALHKRMNTEFENLSNRIFQSKAEDFTRLNTEHLGNLLRPLGDNLKDFRQKVEQVYSTEAKERFSLGERIKELMDPGIQESGAGRLLSSGTHELRCSAGMVPDAGRTVCTVYL